MPEGTTTGGVPMDPPNQEFTLAGSLARCARSPSSDSGHLDRGRIFALDNRCPHMGFPLERGSVEDGILTCHWRQVRSRKRLHI